MKTIFKKLSLAFLLLPMAAIAACPNFVPGQLSASALNNALAAPCITAGTINGSVISGTPISGSSGSFSTLSASSTVSGVGFSTYLASPPAIGVTAPAAGAFTTLSASSTLTATSGVNVAGTLAANGIVNAASNVNVTGTLAAASNVFVAGTLSGYTVNAASGVNASGTYSAAYSDGTVVDYAAGNGRISVGAADTLTFYTGGIANTQMVQMSASGVAVTTPTAATQAVQLKQVSLFPTVVSSASPDIFGAAGATINYDNTTPVTATSFAAATAAQVGSVKKLIPLQNANMTASANLIIDGATSGTYVMPAGANIEVIPLTTTQFKVTTIFASGTFIPAITFGGGSTGITYSTQYGKFTKIGNIYTITVELVFSNKGSSTGTALLTGLPAAVNQDFSPIITAYNITLTGQLYTILTSPGATTLQIYPISNGTIGSQLTDAAFANNSVLRFTGSYHV